VVILGRRSERLRALATDSASDRNIHPSLRTLEIQAEIKNTLIERMQKLIGDLEYKAYLNGGWRMFQGNPNAAPGESCTAMFARYGGGDSRRAC
jgi:hypothetical protein